VALKIFIEWKNRTQYRKMLNPYVSGIWKSLEKKMIKGKLWNEYTWCYRMKDQVTPKPS
jgi:hypothetical protein